MSVDFIPGTKLLAPHAYYDATRDEPHYVRAVQGSFEDRITKGQRKRIAKCERFGFTVTERASIVTCFPIIAENRARKGRSYGMSMCDWVALHRAYPGSVQCFTVDPGPIAAAMCVLVRYDVLYVQGWGDVPGQEQNSPVTLLARGIYRWCEKNGVAEMDIGIAGEEGLVRFKQSLGFEVRQ